MWPSVEPLKDAQANEKNISMGVECRDNVAAANGYSFPELCVQNGKDRQLMVDNGLNPDVVVGTVIQPETGNGDQEPDGGPVEPPATPARRTDKVRGTKPSAGKSSAKR